LTYWLSLCNSGAADILAADCTAASFTEASTISLTFFLKETREAYLRTKRENMGHLLEGF
jgi:hypothetical protein